MAKELSGTSFLQCGTDGRRVVISCPDPRPGRSDIKHPLTVAEARAAARALEAHGAVRDYVLTLEDGSRRARHTLTGAGALALARQLRDLADALETGAVEATNTLGLPTGGLQ